MTEQPSDHTSGASGVLQRLRRAPQSLRQEEWFVAAFVAFAVALCVAAGTGFRVMEPTYGYVSLLFAFVFAPFLISRSAYFIPDQWLSSFRPLRTLHRLRSLESRALLRHDLHALRGFVLVLTSLTVYTNLKIRIPFLNDRRSDDIFVMMDQMWGADRLVAWMTTILIDNPALTTVLATAFRFFYIPIVVLVVILYLRRRQWEIRLFAGSLSVMILLAICFALLSPSLGPALSEPEGFGWLDGRWMHELQQNLLDYLRACIRLHDQGAILPAAPLAGIAGFPSTKVAALATCAIVAGRIHSWLAIFFALLTLLMLIATVVFGFHYGVGAVAGLLLGVIVPIAFVRFLEPDRVEDDASSP